MLGTGTSLLLFGGHRLWHGFSQGDCGGMVLVVVIVVVVLVVVVVVVVVV